MQFLGSCKVCGKVLRTYRSLAGHLRHNQDTDHLVLRAEWLTWRGSYRATLSCRKCDGTWEITSKAEKDQKNCPSCRELRAALGKRSYEKIQRGVKAHVNAPLNRFTWVPGDGVYCEVESALRRGDRIPDVMRALGLTFKSVRSIAEHIFGPEGYKTWAQGKRRAVTLKAQEAARQA
jgi:hypothetical protein